MIVTSDLGNAAHYCDKVAVMQAGRVIEINETHALRSSTRPLILIPSSCSIASGCVALPSLAQIAVCEGPPLPLSPSGLTPSIPPPSYPRGVNIHPGLRPGAAAVNPLHLRLGTR